MLLFMRNGVVGFNHTPDAMFPTSSIQWTYYTYPSSSLRRWFRSTVMQRSWMLWLSSPSTRQLYFQLDRFESFKS
jgi:hypothetical protein